MDFLSQLGPLALSSRFRRLSDRLSQDIALLYKELDVPFEPRWYPVYCLLSAKNTMGVVDIARMLGVSHPAINQIAGEMIEAGLVQAMKDDSDRRRRLLTLTDKGRTIRPMLEETWSRIQTPMRGLLNATGVDIMGTLDKLEQIVDEQGVYARFIDTQNELQQAAKVTIVEYDPVYAEAFKRLNLEWIEKYFTVEPEDEVLLNNPKEAIVDKGGVILFALSAGTDEEAPGEVLGTCALIKQASGAYEFSKMAITEKARGRQIGKQLLDAAIEKARHLEAEELILDASSAAVNLYQKLGFVLLHEDKASQVGQAPETRMRLQL